MPASEPLEILLTHDRWATRNLLSACAALSPEQFHQTFLLGRGSLHDTVVHLLAAMRGWTDLLAGREPAPRVDQDGNRHTPEELLALHDAASTELASLAREHPLNEIVSALRGGKKYSFTRGAVLTHVTTHGMHHRAQALNMLRQLGVSALPASSVMEWTFAEAAPP